MQKIECRQEKETKFRSILESPVRSSLFFFFFNDVAKSAFLLKPVAEAVLEAVPCFQRAKYYGHREVCQRNLYPFGLASSCHLRKVNFDGAITLILSLYV